MESKRQGPTCCTRKDVHPTGPFSHSLAAGPARTELGRPYLPHGWMLLVFHPERFLSPYPATVTKLHFKSYYSEGLIFYGPMEAVGGTLIEFPLLVKLVLQLNLSGKELSFISVDSMILLSLIRHFFGKEKSSNNPTWESCRLGPGFSSSADTDLIKHGNLKFRLSSRRDI